MAYPTGNHPESNHTSNMTDTHSPSTVTMMHNPVLATEWTSEEQETLVKGLQLYSSESKLFLYAKIAQHLPTKTVRDVALRCRWMTKKEANRRRKEEQNLTRNSRDKKERVTLSSAKSSQLLDLSNVPSSSQTMIPMGNGDSSSFRAIGGGVITDILEKNARVLHRIAVNISNHQTHENVNLFCEARDSILRIQNELNKMPLAIMKRMPPLSVQYRAS